MSNPWFKKPEPKLRTVKVVLRNNTQALQFDVNTIRLVDGCLILENIDGFIVAGFARNEWNTVTEIKKG